MNSFSLIENDFQTRKHTNEEKLCLLDQFPPTKLVMILVTSLTLHYHIWHPLTDHASMHALYYHSKNTIFLHQN